MSTVKSWRVLSARPLKVGDSLRQRGDFVPEAKDWQSLRANVDGGFIEEVWVDEEAIEQNKKEIADRNKPAKKKIKAKKSTKARKVVKKKGKSNVRNNSGKRELVEQSI